jgi:hypothetical protein
MEILVMRSENEKRIQEYVEASDRDSQYQRHLQVKNKEADQESRKQRMHQLESIYYKRREDVTEMQQERKQITKAMLKEQERELRMKQKKAEEVRRREEEFRLKKEMEKREQERRIREENERKAAAEEAEAKKAEKLVKALEKKEREWMMKLKDAQVVQESAFEQLETALQTDVIGFPGLMGIGPSAHGGLAGGVATFGSGGGDSDNGAARSHGHGGSHGSGGKKLPPPGGRLPPPGKPIPVPRGRVGSKGGGGHGGARGRPGAVG